MGFSVILVMCTFCEALRCGRSGSGVVGREIGWVLLLVMVVDDSLLLFARKVWWCLNWGRYDRGMRCPGVWRGMEGVGL